MAHLLLWSASLLVLATYANGEEECPKTYNLIGCYVEYIPGALLFSDRDKFKWGNLEQQLKELACKCSKAAKNAGYAGFAMHFYGECYGRSESQLSSLSSKGHEESKCVGDQTYTICDKEKHDHCTGGDFAEAIYVFKTSADKNIDGGLGEWENWTPCDKECGFGHRRRERNCNNPLPKGTGKDCSKLGPLSASEACKVKDCPVDGGWSAYGEYGQCTKECGGGVKIRKRTCTHPTPAHGGEPCVGKSEETMSCNTDPCPVDGGWSAFGDYGACSKSCDGGTKKKYRICNNPKPSNGGKQCSGPPEESASCNTQRCPVDGGWSAFGSYGACSKSCGGGIKKKYRTCDNPKPAYEGKQCAGSTEKSSVCNTQKCPVDGGWSAFGAYGACSKSCGGGLKKRYRTCSNPKPSNGGEQCSGTSEESASCNTKRCPVNGGWSGFGAYGRCNKNCDGGIKKRYRTCSNPRPSNGGNRCPGSSEESAVCNSLKCPGIINCNTKYTSYQTHSSGNMVFIDRHRMNCGGAGYILSMFHLQRSGRDKMRYQYKCCNFKDTAVCTNERKTTSFSYDGKGNAVYLDRHSANCGTTGYINDFKVERNSGHNKVRYSYYCCMLKSTWRGKSHCYTTQTSMTDDGNGKVYYLDRQTVKCRDGYALSYFKLFRNRSHDKWAYHYRCCKINY